jgi:pyruvate/2-oxoglutarate/acetoin dehydrogenase E1 component
MRELTYAEAIEDALAQAMAADERVVVFGEDAPGLRMNLYARFGEARVRPAPISESAFLGAAVGAAMAGLRPVVEIMLIDFIAVAADALVNHAAKIDTWSGGDWKVPMVVRASCGGGYGDGGQHEQTLWGWLAHIPGIKVVVPSTPADAGGLLLGALEDGGPVVYMEHKLLSDYWRDYLGSGGRTNVTYDVPAAGARGPVPEPWDPIPLGVSVTRREGSDLTIVGAGVGVHRALEAAERLATNSSVEAAVIDLRSIQPLDRDAVCGSVSSTGRLVVVDEDYLEFGLSGELAAILMESGIAAKFARVAVEDTIPYDIRREGKALPNVDRIVAAAEGLLEG